MITIAPLQDAKGPDEAATSVRAVVQSSKPPQDMKMNEAAITTGQRIALLPDTRKHLEDAIETLISLLDHLDGDPDLEPSMAGYDSRHMDDLEDEITEHPHDDDEMDSNLIIEGGSEQ